MYISLNENEDALKYLDECDISKDSYGKLLVIARYYLAEGNNTKNTREKLCEFVSKSGKSPLLNYWSDMIDTVMKQAKKRKPIEIDYISITQAEMDKIDSLSGIQVKRLAFTLLCLSKYRDATIAENDHWICFEHKDIMNMANIKASLLKQADMYRQLKDSEYIKFPKKKNSISMQVLFGNDDSNVVLKITNFKNLGYQYLKFKGEPYFECESCGLTVKRSHPDAPRAQKYCNQCAALIQAKQKTDYVMRLRDSIK